MLPAQIFRSIHTNGVLWQATNEYLLALLKLYRKKPGYTIANCEKALALHENDFNKAKTWLREQAQQHDWTQAAKLQGHNINEGLIRVIVDGQYAAIAEINCETNIMVRSEEFRNLTKTVVSTVLDHAKSRGVQNEVRYTTICTDDLKVLRATDGKTLNDHSTLVIGNMDENISLKRALAVSVLLPDVKLFGWASVDSVHIEPNDFGYCGAIMAIKSKHDCYKLGKELCQHIIVNNPVKIGNPLVDKPNNNMYQEPCMIYQKFLFDNLISVQQLLNYAEAKIVDFVRFQRNETLKTIETCG